MLSFLVVRGAAGGDDAVSALDLLELDRPLQAKVVVLSACETGVVEPGRADDFLGLPSWRATTASDC